MSLRTALSNTTLFTIFLFFSILSLWVKSLPFQFRVVTFTPLPLLLPLIKYVYIISTIQKFPLSLLILIPLTLPPYGSDQYFASIFFIIITIDIICNSYLQKKPGIHHCSLLLQYQVWTRRYGSITSVGLGYLWVL